MTKQRGDDMSVEGRDGYDGGRCHCGSCWFRLEPDPEANMPEAVVCIDRRGIVTGFSGKPVCSECGTDWTDPRDRLRVVGAPGSLRVIPPEPGEF